jgi:hypothetical protein
MEQRSVTHRNILGGFFGGFLGILTCGYVHFLMTPVGLILGLLGGFYYQEIGALVAREWNLTQTRVSSTRRRVRASLYLYSRKPKRITRKIWRNADVIVFWPLNILGTIIVWMFSNVLLLSGFRRLLRKHPMNIAYALRGVAATIFYGTNSVLLCLFARELWSHAVKGSGSEGLILIGGILFGSFTLMVGITTFSDHGEELRALRYFYKSWQRLENGKAKFFCEELVTLYRNQVAMFLMLLFAMTYWFIAGAAYLAVVFAPVMAVAGFVKGIYHLAMRTDHWLCLISTVLVTFTAAYFGYSHFGSTILLWGIAFLTGAVSGLVTEFARKLLAQLYAASAWLMRTVEEPATAKLGKANRVFWRGFTAGAEVLPQL